jgi:hypothetical protein
MKDFALNLLGLEITSHHQCLLRYGNGIENQFTLRLIIQIAKDRKATRRHTHQQQDHKDRCYYNYNVHGCKMLIIH